LNLRQLRIYLPLWRWRFFLKKISSPSFPLQKGGSFNPLFKEKNDSKPIKLSKRDSIF
jgi:hypothetical protein